VDGLKIVAPYDEFDVEAMNMLPFGRIVLAAYPAEPPLADNWVPILLYDQVEGLKIPTFEVPIGVNTIRPSVVSVALWNRVPPFLSAIGTHENEVVR
jgi:hypothetical protein